MLKLIGFTIFSGAIIFIGSALLFLVQPMMGKFLLPQYGGTAAVWTTCLVAFQLLLLGGYAYTVVITRLSLLLQVSIHTGLLVIIAVFSMNKVFDNLETESLPLAVQVLLSVILSIGPAYLLLASGSTLMQSWSALAQPNQNAYRLYAISNAGSLIGLFAYPFLIESYISTSVQLMLWRASFFFYALILTGFGFWMLNRQDRRKDCANRMNRVMDALITDIRQQIPVTSISLSWPFWWWILPLVGTFLLTAETSALTLDVTPMPMMWCLLLGSFLLSYVIGFTRFGEMNITLWAVLASLFITCHSVMRLLAYSDLFYVLFVGNGVMLFGCLFLHSWLYSIRPAFYKLPLYYFGVAAGGAIGGIAAGLVSPLLFDGVYEYGFISIFISGLMAWRLFMVRRRLNKPEVVVAISAFILIVVAESGVAVGQIRESILRNRNFYGVLRVKNAMTSDKNGQSVGVARVLVNGATTHGFQIRNAALQWQGTTYYGRKGGGLPVLTHPLFLEDKPLRVGIVGLGIGTLAIYGREGDNYRFLEINPQVVAIAWNTNLFTCLSDSEAAVDVATGDARKLLEEEKSVDAKKYDVLIIDAFSGDSIPVHLLTKEAIDLYFDRLAINGVVAFHISNRFLDLLPLLKAQAKNKKTFFRAWAHVPTDNRMETKSIWVVLTKQGWMLHDDHDIHEISEKMILDYPVITDDFGSILFLIDWDHQRMSAYMSNTDFKK